MSLLNNLHRKLYSHKKQDVDKRHEDADYWQGLTDSDQFYQKQEELELQGKNDGKKDASSKYMKLGIAFLALLIMGVAAFYIYVKLQEESFQQENVKIEIAGENWIESGGETSFILKIVNDNRARLKPGELKIEFPEELVFQKEKIEGAKETALNQIKMEVGEVAGKSEKEIELFFEVSGLKDSQLYLDAYYIYQPENFSSNFERKQHKSFTINSSIFDVSLISFNEAAQGEVVDLDVFLENKSKETVNDVVLEFELPAMFSIVNVENAKKREYEENQYLIEKISPNEKKRVVVSGNVEGEVDSVQRFNVLVSKKDEEKNRKLVKAEDSIKIIPSRIDIVQTIIQTGSSNLVGEGDKLELKIAFRNNTSNPLRDLVLREKIDGNFVDINSVNPGLGYYDNNNSEIVWRASDVESLKILNPNQEGSVEWSFSVKEDIDFTDNPLKNETINARANINSQDIDSPLGRNKTVISDQLELKVKTRTSLEAFGWRKGGEYFENQGPYPLEDGKSTDFTLGISAKNTLNDVSNVVLKAKLPTQVQWKNKYEPAGKAVEFNERTNELTWEIGNLPAGTGYSKEGEKLFFQISIEPEPNQAGGQSTRIELLKNIILQGEDKFTGEKIEVELRPLELFQLENL